MEVVAGIYYELVKGGLGNEYSRSLEKISVKRQKNLEKMRWMGDHGTC